MHPLYVAEAAEAAGGNGGVSGGSAEVLLERALFGGEGGLGGVLGGAHAAKEAAVSGWGRERQLGLARKLACRRRLVPCPGNWCTRTAPVLPTLTCRHMSALTSLLSHAPLVPAGAVQRGGRRAGSQHDAPADAAGRGQ